MKILSTNRATPVAIAWKGSEQTTGIYKRPQAGGIFLNPEGVQGDTVGNPEVHGGRYKACYLFAADAYPYWQQRYPGLAWEYGMFGENLSVAGLDEARLTIGSVFRVGDARIRITTPREPCFKLGIRFKDQGIIEEFIAHGRPGAYAEVLGAGWVRPGDTLEPEAPVAKAMSVADYFGLLYAEQKDARLLAEALQWPYLSDKTRAMLNRWLRSENPS